MASTGPRRSESSAACSAVWMSVRTGRRFGFGDGAKDARALRDAGAAEAMNRGAVRLVVAGFEDVRDVKVGGDALDGVGHAAGVCLGLNDAGAGDEKERAAAESNVAKCEAARGEA